jgi:site-specific recombinase XerD
MLPADARFAGQCGGEQMSRVFKSEFAESIRAFLKHKRNLGYKYSAGEYQLSTFDKYCASHGFGPQLSRESVEGWIFEKEAATPSPYRGHLSPVREFGRFLTACGDTEAYVISDRFTCRRYRPAPYCLTENEICRFFDACSGISGKFKWRTVVLPAFFMLMHCCGLRTVEARTLLLSDAHIDEGFFDIMGSKHRRSRRVFLADDVKSFFERYDREISTVFSARRFFFPSSESGCCSSACICNNFNDIWDAAGLRKPCGKQPGPYAFRHHFAFANINRWTAEGKNVNAMLPYLMRYMGHGSLESTYYYIHLVPDFFADYAKLTQTLEDMIPEVNADYED